MKVNEGGERMVMLRTLACNIKCLFNNAGEVGSSATVDECSGASLKYSFGEPP